MNSKVNNTSLKLIEGGSSFKQGDRPTLAFKALNYRGEVDDLAGKTITSTIRGSGNGIIFEGSAGWDAEKQTITQKMPAELDHGTLLIEFIVTDPSDSEYQVIYPSNESDGRLRVGASSESLDIVGVKSTTVSQLRSEQEALQQAFESEIVPQVDELKQRVEEGIGAFTEDTEVKDARMGETNLRQFNEKTMALLADIAINPASFKQAADPDDTESIKRAVQYGIDQGYRKINLPYKADYLVTKPIYLTGMDDVIVDLNNATVNWNGSEITLQDHNDYDIGIFSAHGSVNESTKTFIQTWDKETYKNVNIIPEANHSGKTLKCSKITVSNTAPFAKGDYIVFTVGDPNNAGNADYQNVFKPTVEVLTQIIEIVGNEIYIDYYSPYDWSQVDITQGFIRKANPIKNVQVKNFFINDITPYEAPDGITGSNPDRNKLVCGVGLRYAVNFTVENIHGLAMKLPLVTGRWCYKGKVSELENKYPESHGGGEGYGIQFIRSMKIDVTDIDSNNGNSTVDFSGSSFCSGKRIYSTNTYSYKTIGTHSMAEHDILFEDCTGVFGFSNGVQYFAGMTIGVTLNRCKGIIASTVDSYTEIKVVDSDITLEKDVSIYFAQAHFINSVVRFNPYAIVYGHKRGIAKKPKIIFSNSEIKSVGSDVSLTHSKIRDFKELRIEGGEIDFSSTSKKFTIEDIENILIGSKLTNVGFALLYRSNKVANAVLNVSGSVIENTRTGISENFLLDEIKDVTLLMNIAGTLVNHLSSDVVSLVSLHQSGSNFLNKSNSTIFVNQAANTFYSKILNNLGITNKEFADATKTFAATFKSVGNQLFNVSKVGTGSDVPLVVDRSNFKAPPSVGSLMVNPTDKRWWLAVGTSSTADWIEGGILKGGTTAQRPANSGNFQPYFDTDLNKQIIRYGSTWVDANGNLV